MDHQGQRFSERLRARAHTVHTWLCVGIDPDLARLPAGVPRTAAGITTFCTELIGATAEFAAAFKLNFAFFEALGPDGWHALAAVRRAIPSDIPVIADAKRGDIANTSAAYAQAVFERLNFDAVTVNPYLGWDAIEPFTRFSGKCVFVLCKTSNPGATAYQDVAVNGDPLFLTVARDALAQHTTSEIGLVMGATHPAALRSVRSLSEELMLLVPGVGVQGADAAQTVSLGGNARGDNAIIPMSRNILFASSGADFARAAADAAASLASQAWATPREIHGGR